MKNFKKRTPVENDPYILPEEEQTIDPETGKRKDIYITCCNCGNDFLFSASEQEYFASRNLHTPKRCLKCRRLRKEELQAQGLHNG